MFRLLLLCFIRLLDIFKFKVLWNIIVYIIKRIVFDIMYFDSKIRNFMINILLRYF